MVPPVRSFLRRQPDELQHVVRRHVLDHLSAEDSSERCILKAGEMRDGLAGGAHIQAALAGAGRYRCRRRYRRPSPATFESLSSSRKLAAAAA